MNNINATFQELKNKLNKASNVRENSFQACCPAHKDDTPSLTVTKADDKIVVYCHAGCEPESIVNSLGLKMNDLFLSDNSGSGVTLKSNETIYPYYDENGTYLFEKVRTEKLKGVFRTTDSEGNIIWGRTKGVYYETYSGSNQYSRTERPGNATVELKTSIPNILYRLSEVVEGVKNDKTIFILEGEKDVDNARKLGIIATCNPDGAGRGKFKKSYAKYLLNADVVVVPDNDQAGEDHVKTIAENLKGQVKSLKVVRLPGETKGFDFTDYIEAGHTKEDFLKLVKEAENMDMSKEMNYVFENDIYEAEGCYFKETSKEPKLIANFTMKLIEEIRHDEGILMIADITSCQGYRERVQFEAKDFGNKRKFLEIIANFNFMFKGNEVDLQSIKELVSKQSRKITVGVNRIGFHEIEGKKYYITDTGAIDQELNKTEDIVFIGHGGTSARTNILETDPINADELKEIASSLFRFNELESTASILGTVVTYFMKPLLFDKGIKPSHLLIYGESGAGKTTTLTNAILPLFSTKTTQNAGGITNFTLIKNTSSTDTIPIVLDEYKPGMMADKINNAISEALRNTYDCTTSERGRGDQLMNKYPLISPMILVGEEGQTETAVIERSMIIQLSKSGTLGTHRQAMTVLQENRDLLNKLGRSILNYVIKKDINEIVKTRKNISEKVIESIKENRVADTVTNALLGIDVIVSVFEQLGLKFSEETNITPEEIYKAVLNNANAEVLDYNEGTKSAIDNTIELLSNMTACGEYTKDFHYVLINNNTELAIHISSMFNDMTGYIKNKNVEGYFLKKRNDFTKQLRKQPYFLKYDTCRFGDRTKKAYVLSIETLLKQGIDISGFIE